MEKRIRKHIIFMGRVQGVGFRYHAYYAAQEFGLTGWVRNLYDGTVEMEVQGLEEQIDCMIASLERARYIQISQMEVKSRDVEETERSFRIR